MMCDMSYSALRLLHGFSLQLSSDPSPGYEVRQVVTHYSSHGSYAQHYAYRHSSANNQRARSSLTIISFATVLPTPNTRGDIPCCC